MLVQGPQELRVAVQTQRKVYTETMGALPQTLVFNSLAANMFGATLLESEAALRGYRVQGQEAVGVYSNEAIKRVEVFTAHYLHNPTASYWIPAHPLQA